MKLRITLILLIGLALVSGVAFADTCTDMTKYEYYETGGTSNASAYGSDWLAQTFTATSGHIVGGVRLELYRVGSPGTVTMGIRSTDASGHPTGDDWTTTTINGSAVTTNSSGEWYCFDFDSELVIVEDGVYSIVLSAAGGVVNNTIHWLYNSSGSYSGGNAETSDDSGVSWGASSADDFMFAIYGYSGLGIEDVKVFADVIEYGDLYIAVLYKNLRPSEYPLSDPESFYDIILATNTTDVAKRPLPAWGYAPASLYISPATRSTYGVMWQGDGYELEMAGRPVAFEMPPSYSWDIEDTDWVGPYVWELCDNWIVDSAEAMEDYYGIDLLMETYGGEALDKPILNPLGCEIFLAGMPELEELCPYSFYVIVHDLEWGESEYGGEFEESHDWVEILGGEDAQIPTAITEMAGVFGISPQIFGAVSFFILTIAMMAAVVGSGTMSIVPGLVLGILVLTVGAWMGFVAYAAIAVAASIAVAFFMWVLWFSR